MAQAHSSSQSWRSSLHHISSATIVHLLLMRAQTRPSIQPNRQRSILRILLRLEEPKERVDGVVLPNSFQCPRRKMDMPSILLLVRIPGSTDFVTRLFVCDCDVCLSDCLEASYGRRVAILRSRVSDKRCNSQYQRAPGETHSIDGRKRRRCST
jgi:hypothetical protein